MVKAIKYVLMFWTPILVIIVILSIAQSGYHYKGEVELTLDKYTEFMETGLPLLDETNFIEARDDGISTLHYDFYSNSEFKLDRTKSTLTDNVLVNNLKEDLPVILTSIGLMSLFMFSMSRGYISQNKIYRLITTISDFIIGKLDKRYPESSNYYISIRPPVLPLGDIKGILCVRSWNVDRNGTLTSIVQSTKWDGKELIAGKNPNKNGDNGIYAYRLGSSVVQSSEVMGIVELDGKYEYHPDGVIRAEHCRMLCLFTFKAYQRLGHLVSYRYNLPLYYGETPEFAYLKWLYSASGQKCLQYNFELLKEDAHGNGNNT